jgi:hypothetical protein
MHVRRRSAVEDRVRLQCDIECDAGAAFYDLRLSLILWLLAESGKLCVGRLSLGLLLCLTLARAYTIPLTKPTKIAETLPNVTGASKKMRPLMAIGSLFNAPTIEYVVEEVTRTHHAEV